MKKVIPRNMYKGKIYLLINENYRKPERDKFIFLCNGTKLDYGCAGSTIEMVIIKDLSSDGGWSLNQKSFAYLDSDEIYELTEKEALMWCI